VILYLFFKLLDNKKLRFLIGGGVSTSVAFITFPSFYFLSNENFILSAFLASMINISFSFLVQKFFVFRTYRNNTILEFKKFILGSLLTIIVSSLLIFILINYLDFHYFYSNSLVILCIVIFNWFFYSKFIFNQQKNG
jgi:putative flippase GtrA